MLVQLLDNSGLNLRSCVRIDVVTGCGDVRLQTILHLM